MRRRLFWSQRMQPAQYGKGEGCFFVEREKVYLEEFYGILKQAIDETELLIQKKTENCLRISCPRQSADSLRTELRKAGNGYRTCQSL